MQSMEEVLQDVYVTQVVDAIKDAISQMTRPIVN